MGAVCHSSSESDIPALSAYEVGCQGDVSLLGEMVKLVFFPSSVSNRWRQKPLTELSPLQTE